MTEVQKSLPVWILIVSGIFALMEIMVSILLFLSPQSVAENVDLSAKGVNYIIQIWAARQLALGVVFAFATFKRSAPMLTIAYLFFLVMFICEFFIGIIQKESGLAVAAVVMGGISSVMIFVINRKR